MGSSDDITLGCLQPVRRDPRPSHDFRDQSFEVLPTSIGSHCSLVEYASLHPRTTLGDRRANMRRQARKVIPYLVIGKILGELVVRTSENPQHGGRAKQAGLTQLFRSHRPLDYKLYRRKRTHVDIEESVRSFDQLRLVQLTFLPSADSAPNPDSDGPNHVRNVLGAHEIWTRAPDSVLLEINPSNQHGMLEDIVEGSVNHLPRIKTGSDGRRDPQRVVRDVNGHLLKFLEDLFDVYLDRNPFAAKPFPLTLQCPDCCLVMTL